VRAAAVALGLAICLAACGSSEQSAAGIVTDIDTLGVGRVQGFTLRTQDGTELAFAIEGGTDLAGGGWPPDHLQEHRATATGVAVVYRMDGERRVVTRLDDAPWIGR
jgi:hypothetical protein